MMPASRKGATAWLRRIASLLVHAIAGVLWIVLGAWLIGRVLTDRFEWSQWLWWMPPPAALLAALLGWMLAFRSARDRRHRLRRIAAWSACCICVSAYLAVREHRLLVAAPVPPSSSLTVAHWNMTMDNRADIPEMLRLIDGLDSDLILLTSAPGHVREDFRARPGANTLDTMPMMLHSRLPITHSRTLVATDLMFITLVEIDATARLGRSITLYMVDLPSNPRRGRMAIAREARRLLDQVGAPPPDLIVGDFNMTRGSASIDWLFPDAIDAYDTGGHGWGATFPRRLPVYHIDHVLTSEASGLRAARYDIIDTGHSRHRAQKAWIVAAP